MNTKDVVDHVTRGGGWVFLPKRARIAVCAPSKNGCSAIYGSIAGMAPTTGARIDAIKILHSQGLGPFYPHELEDKGLRLYFAVRDPVDRFASLWRCFCRDKEPGTGTRVIGGMSPKQLLHHITHNLGQNRHWIPQEYHYAHRAVCIDFRKFLEFLDLPSPKVNVTKSRSDDPPMPADQIRELYHEDQVLWLSRIR